MRSSGHLLKRSCDRGRWVVLLVLEDMMQLKYGVSIDQVELRQQLSVAALMSLQALRGLFPPNSKHCRRGTTWSSEISASVCSL